MGTENTPSINIKRISTVTSVKMKITPPENKVSYCRNPPIVSQKKNVTFWRLVSFLSERLRNFPKHCPKNIRENIHQTHAASWEQNWKLFSCDYFWTFCMFYFAKLFSALCSIKNNIETEYLLQSLIFPFLYLCNLMW